jgi:hypothetical protein
VAPAPVRPATVEVAAAAELAGASPEEQPTTVATASRVTANERVIERLRREVEMVVVIRR